ncbi:hypothetical protein ABIF73_009042 [Bradyrhizobium japonicum]|uniref:EAL domain-containing protein n=1 Tax=Bradyrhizobium japonicum TaxID=375 RepID=UPI0033972AAB
MATLKVVGMRPDNLTIEVTETTALNDTVANADVMSRLCIKGVSLSLDDFGTGHASLRNLQIHPFEESRSTGRTNAPAWASPSTPWPSTSTMRSSVGLLKQCPRSAATGHPSFGSGAS